VMEMSNLALVLVKVTVAVPVHVASASVIGGFSFAAFSSALKVLATVGTGLAVGEAVGVGVDTAAVPPQAATKIAVAAMPANRRMFSILLDGSSGIRPVASFG
jgi:F0F1-type ATP synthase membrane subunit c/vacuolar-type H+-ATPase subunit K